jgi:hypothetical protein
MNKDKEKAGYFEENGRIRCVKFRGNKSEGFFIEHHSLDFTEKKEGIATTLALNSEFDEFNGVPICNKYVPKYAKTPGTPGSGKKGKGKLAKESKLVDNQFRFHDSTSMLYKNLHKVHPDSLISITYKLHGTSAISSKLLTKKKLTKWNKFLKFLKGDIKTTEYDYLYSSRTVIKNSDLNPNAVHFYDTDVWGEADKKLREFIQNGMTLYYEIVGHTSTGAVIQKGYDYGYYPEYKDSDDSPFGIYIYRITYTNTEGKVFEFSAKQVQDWCKTNGLNAVPEMYYGLARYASPYMHILALDPEYKKWRGSFLQYIKDAYNEKDCYMCTKKVPEEGVVIRIEGNDFEAYKAKSVRFYEWETKQLDKGEIDIETEN